MASIAIPPIELEEWGCKIYILEVVKTELFGSTWYHASVKVRCGDVESRVFTVDARSARELKARIKAEIAKLKILEIAYGKEFARRVVA